MKQILSLLTLTIVIIFSVGCGKKAVATTAQKNQPTKTPNNGDEKQAALAEEGKDDPPKGLLGGLNDLLKEADKIGQEILGLDLDERKKVGELVHEHVTEEHDIAKDQKQMDRIQGLAKPFLKKVKDLDLAWKFTILESDTVNAFSHVGGYIYFNTALLDAMESDEELQFIIGHEVGHVLLKHCAQKVAFSMRAREIGAELGGDLGGALAEQITQAAYGTISVAYNENQEFASDKWSYETLREAGHPKQSCLAGVLWLVKQEEENRKTRVDEDPDNDNEIIKAIDNHFRTHPAADQRLTRLKNLD